MKQATLILLLFPFALLAQDSLFLSTDKPGTSWEDNPVTLGMKFTTAIPGVIKAVKFYKTDNRADKTYEIGIWDNGNVKLTMVPVATTAIGWIRVPVNIPIGSGTFIIGVYNPYGRYKFGNNVYPRTRGKLSGISGTFENGNTLPGRTTPDCYYMDVVFSPQTQPVFSTVTPDSVNISYPWNPVTLTATATNAISYGWAIEDSSGTWNIDTTNRLKPIITAKSYGNLFLVFTATGADGLQWSSISMLYAEPDPNRIIGYLMEGGRVYYRKAIVVF